MSDKVGRINQWSTCLMLASLFFTIIASYPVHRPGSKPTLTYAIRRPLFEWWFPLPSPYHRKRAFLLCFLFCGLLGKSWYEWFGCWGIGICFFSRTCFGLSLRFGYFECPSSPLLWNRFISPSPPLRSGLSSRSMQAIIKKAFVRPYERTDQAMNDVDHSRGGMVSLSLSIGSRCET